MKKEDYMLWISAVLLIISISYTIYSIESIKSIRLEFDYDEFDFLNKSNHTLNGKYNLKTHNVLIYCKEREIDSVVHTAYHEIGHYFWFNFLSDEKQEEYCNIFKNSNFFVSKYAMTNCGEDFAESYASFNLKEIELDEKRKEFFKKI